MAWCRAAASSRSILAHSFFWYVFAVSDVPDGPDRVWTGGCWPAAQTAFAG